ncbi:hypothetical protein HYDPIDRAFT_29040 [Hydnomerulius pinastri MD-312]|uniref:Uncharacterized protein n=1 Tax=Hydnomerulius pinastri MD-312 TaxID=994086 RepID=A0A0C9W0A2_9AGAM|nr:hypothetical protein HYDPIDRAFT_29040 [Hydnomerulius pinastri MD-312]
MAYLEVAPICLRWFTAYPVPSSPARIISTLSLLQVSCSAIHSLTISCSSAPAPAHRHKFKLTASRSPGVQSAVFNPKVIYDLDVIAYSSHVLVFGNLATFDVNMSDHGPPTSQYVWRVTLTRVYAADVDF